MKIKELKDGDHFKFNDEPVYRLIDDSEADDNVYVIAEEFNGNRVLIQSLDSINNKRFRFVPTQTVDGDWTVIKIDH